VLLALLLGCIPLPYAVPPADFGAALNPLPAVGTGVAPAAVDLRVGLTPLSVFQDQRRRTYDPSFGFLASVPIGQRPGMLALGGYGRVAMRVWREDFVDGRGFMTVEPRVTADVVVDTAGRPGGQFLLGGAFRLASWAEREAGGGFGPGGGWVGVSHGESGIAFVVDGGAAYTPNGALAPLVLLGVELRAPASAGVLLVPVF